MTGKYNRSYVNCWDHQKINQTLEARLNELKTKDGKSKSRIKLLRSKIARLTRALEGRAFAGGQVLPKNPYKGAKNGPKHIPYQHNRPFGSDMAPDSSFSNPIVISKVDPYAVADEAPADALTMENGQFPPTMSHNHIDFNPIPPASSIYAHKGINSAKKKTKKICFRCRKRGHLLKDCRENPSASICFRCGSTEHILKGCPNVAEGDEQTVELPFASCFVCGQTGHLSSQCSQNPKGMFPKGSGCYFCGSVRHKRASCPLLKGGAPNSQIDPESAVFIDNSGHHQQPE